MDFLHRVKLFTTLILLVIVIEGLSARHIVGGELTYECLGDGDSYRFTLLVYRDCAAANAGQYDSFGNGLIGTVSIYEGSNLLRNIQLDTPDVVEIPAETDNPCLIVPQNVCVQRGVYTFIEELPNSPETYTITYSRCCRNLSITNLIAPGDTGATYTIDLTPTAQTSCNNSPTFNDFPDILICVGEPLNFDHSATDAEGDQLIYSFCSPFVGGGPNGGGNQSTELNGVAPNPDAPPPYIDVSFAVPSFTSSQPLAGNPVVQIDPITGLITGTPRAIGQYVVGVCVEEYRNGELLSTVRRDFQFNIEECDPLVQADIIEDVFLGDNTFEINICGEKSFQFRNESSGDIRDFLWEFDLGTAGIQTFDVWEPLIEFPESGQYNGILILNPSDLCGDTANIIINVFPELEPDFQVEYDTCSVGPVSFIDESQTNGSDIMTWNWDFGEGNFSNDQNPLFFYDQFGSKSAILTIEDNNGCAEMVEIDFDWRPRPVDIVIRPSSFIACTPGTEVTFENLTSPINSSYDIFWDFGDGGSSTEISPTYTFKEEGTFTVSLDIISPFDCSFSETFNDWITIKPSPTADFKVLSSNITNLNPQVFFSNESTEDVVRWQWDFAGQGASREENPSFIFRDTGLQEVVLLVTSENGCVDTTFAFIDVVPIDRYTLPNAFTPNFDDKNDIYIGVGTLQNLSSFNMKIWNRYGDLVFETDNQYEGWNGSRFNTGPLLPAGVYTVLVDYESARDGGVQIKGFASLIR